MSTSDTLGDGPWDPSQYEKFSSPRLQPALDLLERIELELPATIYDLGCGNGEVTLQLSQRFPQASITAIDNSEPMLNRARRHASNIRWQLADIANWSPSRPADLIFSNAALHWLPDHALLFPRLVDALAPGGVLAVQMPLSWSQPSHRLMRSILATGGEEGRSPLGDASLRRHLDRPWVLEDRQYEGLLSPLTSRLEIWQTEYPHLLEGDDPVLEWVRGTGLRPILEGLAGTDLQRFMDCYRIALRQAYPQRDDGRTLFPFRRLFLIAQR